MKKLYTSAFLFLASAEAVLAKGGRPCWPHDNNTGPNDVPEISPLEGTAAIAAVLAIVLIAWERRRRAA